MQFRGDKYLGGLTRYDSNWYWIISTSGYQYRPDWPSVAFFPGYPMTMRAVGTVVGDDAIAGILVTILCGLGVAVLFSTWCRDRLAPPTARLALLAFLLYPYGFYLYGVVYSDAFFVFSTLLAFWAVDRDKPLVAGLAGAVATFSRPVGIAVVLGLIVHILQRRGGLSRPGWFGIPTRVTPSVLRPKDSLVLLSTSGLFMYAGFLWKRFGDPFLFSSAEASWGQKPGPRTWLKFEFFTQVRHHYDILFTWGLMLQASLALLALASVFAVGRRFGWGYAAYMAVVLSVPLIGTKDFMGLGRYLIAAFPVFGLFGSFLADRPPLARYAVLTCSGLALIVFGAGFATGRYIS
jgi:hypothetical protein